jgi:hypothetical protein
MLEKSLPKIIFKHDINVNINVKHMQEIQVIVKKEDREKNINEKCVNNSRNKRKELRNMKSFTPQRVAMKCFDDPSKENRAIRDYVNRYVRKLKI